MAISFVEFEVRVWSTVVVPADALGIARDVPVAVGRERFLERGAGDRAARDRAASEARQLVGFVVRIHLAEGGVDGVDVYRNVPLQVALIFVAGQRAGRGVRAVAGPNKILNAVELVEVRGGYAADGSRAEQVVLDLGETYCSETIVPSPSVPMLSSVSPTVGSSAVPLPSTTASSWLIWSSMPPLVP